MHRPESQEIFQQRQGLRDGSSDITRQHHDREARDSRRIPLNLEGMQLGTLHFQRRLGSGGMAEVWRARDTHRNEDVAVKVLHPRHATSRTVVRRFLREARAVSLLSHDNIVRVFRVGSDVWQGQPLRYFVMELVEGHNAHELAAMLPEGLSEESTLRIVERAACALSYAHSRGVIHRDVKPDNILISSRDQSVKLVDFGIARILDPDQDMDSHRDTTEGARVGTLAYMSPEQLRAMPTTSATDVYSLGLSFFELVTGLPPMELVNDRRRLESGERRIDGLTRPILDKVLHMTEERPNGRPSMKSVERDLRLLLGERRTSTVMGAGSDRGSNITNLRARHSSFVGRELELERLREALRVKHSVVTLLGPGGIGKSRLAHQYGLSNLNEWPGGVWWIDLALARSVNAICMAVADAMETPLLQGDMRNQVADMLRSSGRALVIFDNFEQVAELGRETIGFWRDCAQELSFLITSRQPLYLEGEVTLTLEPLPVNAVEGAYDRVPPAVRLFLDRARSVTWGVDVGDSQYEEAATIAARLEGMPLAIELAAARMGSITPRGFLERFGQSLDLLSSQRSDLPARQRTLRDTIRWSWDLLSPWEQAALAQVSVFEGGFLLEAVEDVVDLSPWPSAALELDVIDSLRSKSLLRAEIQPSLPGEYRYDLYDTIRTYAREELERQPALAGADGRLHSLTQRHAQHVLAYVSHWNRRLHTSQAREALLRLSAEHANVAKALKTLQYSGDWSMAVSLFLAYAEYLRTCGPWSLRREYAEALLAGAPATIPPLLTCRLLAEQVLVHIDMTNMDAMRTTSDTLANWVRERLANESIPDNLRRSLDGINAAVQGYVFFRQGRFEQVVETLKRAVALLDPAQDPGWYIDSLTGLTHASMLLSRYDAGMEWAERTLQEGEKRNDPMMTARGIELKGIGHMRLAQPRQAYDYFVRASAMAAELGNLRQQLMCDSNCGTSSISLGNYADAERYLSRVVPMHERLGNQQHALTCMNSLCSLRLDMGRLDEALEISETCLKRARELGNPEATIISVAYHGMVLMHCDRELEAIEFLEDSVQRARAMGTRDFLHYFLSLKAVAELKAWDKDHLPQRLDNAQACAAECMMATGPTSPGLPSAKDGKGVEVYTVLARVHWCRAGLTSGDEAERLRRQALEYARDARDLRATTGRGGHGLRAQSTVKWIEEILAAYGDSLDKVADERSVVKSSQDRSS